MTVRDLVSVGLRFFALWLLLAAFKTFEMLRSVESMAPVVANAAAVGDVVRSMGLVIALTVAAACLLWIACRPISYVLTRGAVSVERIELTPGNMVAAGCALLGLWGLKQSLIPLIEIWVSGSLNSRLSGLSMVATLSSQERIRAVSELAELGLSLVFLCRPYQIGALVLRAGGRQSDSGA